MDVWDVPTKAKHIRELILELPASHQSLIKFLLLHLRALQTAIQDQQEQNWYVSALSYTWGPLFLKPLSEIPSQHIKDHHPFRLLKDLLLHYTDIFQ
jgi:hypothetical protein